MHACTPVMGTDNLSSFYKLKELIIAIFLFPAKIECDHSNRVYYIVSHPHTVLHVCNVRYIQI